MHPVITQQLVADHIREIHARAEAERLPARRVGPGVVHRPFGLVVSLPACSVSCIRLASSARRSCGAVTGSIRMAALSKTFESALLKRAKNFSFRGRILTSA